MKIHPLKEEFAVETKDAAVIAGKLRTVLDAKGNQAMAARFLKGGYLQDGYGVPEGAAIDGSHAFEGTQGYYAKNSAGEETGKKIFIDTVERMKAFFKKRGQRNGRPIRYVIKPGIGGQHTPFQGIADGFEAAGVQVGKIAGEYELGKDYEKALSDTLAQLGADWEQLAVIPSSKSGSTDETMLIFTDIFYILLKQFAIKEGLDGERFAQTVLETLHEINFAGAKERPAGDLFKIGPNFQAQGLMDLVLQRTRSLGADIQKVRNVFSKTLGDMFFETTDRPEQSRLSAFIRNSGLDKELGEDAPGFGAMFDNVGGRWTGDLHMMTFLAYYDLDAEAYWSARESGIRRVCEGRHPGNQLAHRILDEKVKDLVLLVPDWLFWFGKSVEQNFNESLWQEGFANLVAVRQCEWETLKPLYQHAAHCLILNLTDAKLESFPCPVFDLAVPNFKGLSPQKVAEAFADLFTIFYGLTNTVGTRLIARALAAAGFKAGDVDMNDLDNPATRIVQKNLFLLQPYVELGKGLLEKRLKELQELESRKSGVVKAAYEQAKVYAGERRFLTNVNDPSVLKELEKKQDFKKTLEALRPYAARVGRKLVPFIYLEGEGFHALRAVLLEMGLPWVMQGTGDQHISYQQVLAQPRYYLPFIVSFVSGLPIAPHPAIGFAKGYLDQVSPDMVRDLFAEASYQALTGLRENEGGMGFFLRLPRS